ncbi:MAG: glycosyltransferase, partial [Ktedonobacteraceae bacterium]|nr:glycosyltransferase [Ktedonobacteraceae bacterium]
MKLLMVSGYLPHPSWGAGARSYHLLRTLAQHHTVSLLAVADPAETDIAGKTVLLEQYAEDVRIVLHSLTRAKRWRQLLYALRGQSLSLHMCILPSMQQLLYDLLTSGAYDAVLFESVFLAGYDLPVDIPVIIDQHNIEHELLRRTYEHEQSWLRKWYNWREYGPLMRGEIERCSSADLLLVTSERERDLLAHMLPGRRTEVVPNGVDTQAFCPGADDGQEIEHQLIFTGTMDYYPNTEAVLSFAQQCWPRIRARVPDATWLIVGRNPSPAVRLLGELPGVTVVGSVPDVRPYLARA